MYLYRFEVVSKGKTTPVIVVAKEDQQAFDQVDIELEKCYLSLPHYEEIVLFEKKRIGNGSGYVLLAFSK
ncbi:DUF3906 family protein [Bacillus sp. REN10]|uniref:DUF3906 family protein n=1 Tax=Bacillus sp. REN10 TaxID=2782541 RepID=UPI00193BDE97|nr:DUF3906 family protein [Bacillus sp. REN10]